MEACLKQISNTFSCDQNKLKKLSAIKDKKQLIKLLNIRFPLKKLLTISSDTFDFGLCVPNTVHQRVLSITLKQDLSEPISFSMQILCKDEKLNTLPEFVFAIKKDREFEFTDSYRFRLSRRGKYDFVIGVKTPNFDQYNVESELRISTQLSNMKDPNEYYSVKLQQKVCMPKIVCPRQLLSSSGKQLEPLRVLKFSQIKSKPKKQIKIPFKLETDTKLILISDLYGLQHGASDIQKNSVEVQPKQLSLNGNGIFVMGFKFNFTESIEDHLMRMEEEYEKKGKIACYTLRRILIMRVNQTNIHFHFPIEVNFFLGNKKGDFSFQ